MVRNLTLAQVAMIMIGDDKAFPTESEHSDDDAGKFSGSDELMSDEELDKSILDDAFEDKKEREQQEREREKKEEEEEEEDVSW